MARLVWAVLCRDAVIDKDSNNIYLHRVLEQIQLPAESLPVTEDNESTAIQLEGALATLWVRDDLETPEATTMRISLTCPDGQSHLLSEIDIDLSTHRRTRARALFNGLPFHGSGEYDYIVEEYNLESEDWITVATVPLDVQVTEPGEETDSNQA